MKRFRAVCPVDAACDFRGPINRTAADEIHSHVVERHPDMLTSAEERAATARAYRRDLWITYETLEAASG